MSETIVILKSKDLCEEFETLVAENGLKAERIKGLPRFFVFTDIDPDAFPLANYPGIKSIENGQHELHQEEAIEESVQTHALNYGGWAPTRIINRKSPWSPPNHDYSAEAVFECLRTGVGVDIFMIDSGCYTPHQEFTGRAQQPFVLKEEYATPLDDTDHGTGCMSSAGGTTLGLAKQAQLYSYKFHNGSGGATTTGFITAMGAIRDYYEQNAASNRPGIVFCSWGGFPGTINEVIGDLIDVGLPCCFPAGNSHYDLEQIDYYPAESDPDAILCGGLNRNDRPYYTFNGYGTSFGSPVDILAPGQLVVAARRIQDEGDYRYVNGTSFSTPYVVGVLACMLEGYNRLSVRSEVRALKDKLLVNATTGELKNGYAPGSRVYDTTDPDRDDQRLPDRILYLDPTVAFEDIPGLTPKP